MEKQSDSYFLLEPLDVWIEAYIAMKAAMYFHPSQIAERNHESVHSEEPQPVESREFVEYLKSEGVVENVDRRVHQIRHLLARMETQNLLVSYYSLQQDMMLPKRYFCLAQPSKQRKKGALWLSRVLGGRYIYEMISPAVVQIVGINSDGDSRAGSGIVFDPHHVLTCKHVVEDMRVNEKQHFQGAHVTINRTVKHPSIDVAVLSVVEELRPTKGLVFFRPEVSQTIYRFGHGRVPNTKELSAVEPPIERGEVTFSPKITYDDSELFLYSAVSRPGDSGGPIVSDDGYVVGMTTTRLEETVETNREVSMDHPHYAAIPSDIITNAVKELDTSACIPYETFDDVHVEDEDDRPPDSPSPCTS